MENTAAVQLSQLALSLGWGGALGVYYLLLGLLRSRRSALRTAIADMLFWLVAAALTPIFLIVVNGGRASFFMLAAMAGSAVAVRLAAAAVSGK